MIGTIRYTVRLDGKWVSSTPLRAQNGTQYKVVIDRDYGHGEVQLLGGTPVMVAEGPAGVSDMQQAMKNALISLGVRFPNNASPATTIAPAVSPEPPLQPLPTLPPDGNYYLTYMRFDPISGSFGWTTSSGAGPVSPYTAYADYASQLALWQATPGYENALVYPAGPSGYNDGFYFRDAINDVVGTFLSNMSVESANGPDIVAGMENTSLERINPPSGQYLQITPGTTPVSGSLRFSSPLGNTQLLTLAQAESGRTVEAALRQIPGCENAELYTINNSAWTDQGYYLKLDTVPMGFQPLTAINNTLVDGGGDPVGLIIEEVTL